jgi:hypothetical protein
MDIDENIISDENVRWHKHPELGLKVDEGGTHLYHVERECYLTIKKYVYRHCDFIKQRWGSMDYSKIVLESKLGRLLTKGETVEHKNRNRGDDSFDNLVARHRLFQANNRRPRSISLDTNFQGTHYQAGKRYVVACVQMLIIEGREGSKTIKKHFPIKAMGEEAANAAAKEWRSKHTLKDGMIFD